MKLRGLIILLLCIVIAQNSSGIFFYLWASQCLLWGIIVYFEISEKEKE